MQATSSARVVETAQESWRSEIVTRSPALETVLARAKRAAATDAAVCICGASGTGKELFARAIHRASRRREAPFVAVNCAAIPEGVLESELFGHRKGAFTGATQDREGLFQSADGGTLFLDEIGDMPMVLQAKLLRAIEDKRVRPLGANETVAFDVRILAATHRRLEERIASGEFREDLFYRLAVVRLALPTLAERREDIPLLAEGMLARLAQRYRRPRVAIQPEAMQALVAANWPGNVRQLLNVIEQSVALSTTGVVHATLVRQALDTEETKLATLDEARRDFEHEYLVRLLKITSGNVTHAARLAGRNRTEFYRLLDRHALVPASFKPSPRCDKPSQAASSTSPGQSQ